jgi:hypothetical protein
MPNKQGDCSPNTADSRALTCKPHHQPVKEELCDRLLDLVGAANAGLVNPKALSRSPHHISALRPCTASKAAARPRLPRRHYVQDGLSRERERPTLAEGLLLARAATAFDGIDKGRRKRKTTTSHSSVSQQPQRGLFPTPLITL